MVVREFYCRDDQINFLVTLPGTFSEHVRRAIDDYIQKIKNQSISASASKKEGGE